MARIASTAAGAIPVIDIAPLRDGGDAAGVAAALLAASRDLGFIYVSGHRIPGAVIAAAREAAYAFFRAPAADKKRYAISDRHRGWLAPGGARMQDDIGTDLKESFLWGYQDSDGNAPADHPLRGPNQWPDFVPGIERAAIDFFAQADRVARDLLAGFALGLGLEADFFLRNCRLPLSRASFVYYPSEDPQSEAPRFGVGPHTDFGVLTVLCQDQNGGLQIQNYAGDWIEAPPIDGTLVVNVGDLLERWTDGAFRSTPHRVVNTSGRERLSLVLAFDPDPETRIDARDIYGADYPAKQAAITCGDYLIARFARAFAYRDPGAGKHE